MVASLSIFATNNYAYQSMDEGSLVNVEVQSAVDIIGNASVMYK